MEIKIEMDSVDAIIEKHGVGETGTVQKFLTNTICNRMTDYMPFQTGVLATKLKHVASPTTIEVLGPYARYQYYGRRMVDSITGKGPAKIPNVGYRFRRGAKLDPTDQPLHYDTSKNANAGPFWDRRMMAAESGKIEAEVQAFLDGGIVV